eukprot:767661-Hanusia_phi.AAC.2
MPMTPAPHPCLTAKAGPLVPPPPETNVYPTFFLRNYHTITSPKYPTPQISLCSTSTFREDHIITLTPGPGNWHSEPYPGQIKLAQSGPAGPDRRAVPGPPGRSD